MFHRYFFLWFTFFCICFPLTGLFVLHSRWKAELANHQARAAALSAYLHNEFALRAPSSAFMDQWNWEEYYQRGREGFSVLEGLMVLDTVDGTEVVTVGRFPADWNAAFNRARDDRPTWVTLKTGQTLWTTLPAGQINPRYRLWVNVGAMPGFGEFIENRSVFLGILAGLFIALFVIFYIRWGSPSRYLSPLVVNIQSSLDHTDNPVDIPISTLPGEFRPLAKALSLLLEARQSERQDRRILDEQLSFSQRQKDQYSQMIRTIQSCRESEMSAIERMQWTLIQTNREPVILLDRNRRILSMNEPARRVLSLSGQTGYPLRHSELEEILRAELESPRKKHDRTISIRDPYLGKTATWKVSITVHPTVEEPHEIDTIILSLNQETASHRGGSPSSQDLLYLYAGALLESWNEGTEQPWRLTSEERREAVEPLLKCVLDRNRQSCDLEEVLSVFGFAVQSEIPGIGEKRQVSGSLETWKHFQNWIRIVLWEMAGEDIVMDSPSVSKTRIRVEWRSSTDLPFEEWFGDNQDNTPRLRNRLLKATLECINAQLIWKPSTASLIGLEIRLKSDLLAAGVSGTFLPDAGSPES